MSGDIRVHQIHSSSLGESRQVWVYLPPGYAQNSEKRYPVLYVCDGEGAFDERTAHRNVELGLDEQAESLIGQGSMGEIIMVAVATGGNNEARFKDYTPSQDSRYGGGHAPEYLQFLKDELKPMIDSTYTTRSGSHTTGIMGTSLGGLFALYAGFTAPHTFGCVGALSPSLWYANRDMLYRMMEAKEGPDKVWIDVGTQEQQNPQLAQDRIDEFQVADAILREKGYQPGKTMFTQVIEGAEHSQQAFRQRVAPMLQCLYPPESESSGPDR